jgi:primosomal protein N' (replication factor Y)
MRIKLTNARDKRKMLEHIVLTINNRSMNQSQLFEDNLNDILVQDLSGLASVLVPFPIDKSYTYAIPESGHVIPGQYVSVPLGNREVIGVIWDDTTDDVPLDKLKEIIHVYDFTSLSDVHRTFLDWVGRYTMSPRGFVLKMTLAVPGALEPPKPSTGYTVDVKITDKTYQGLSPKRKKVLDILEDGVIRRASELANEAGCSSSVITSMTKAHLLRKVEVFNPAPCLKPNPEFASVKLSAAQQDAADKLRENVTQKSFKVSLLDGVTGAGKTEVYFEAISQALKQERQALILLPEIALSNSFLSRFKKRFGCAPALWHSSLGSSLRKTTWRGVAEGKTKVVVGARSALFLPYKDLGCIVIDEEHDHAFKQEDGVIYHARDMAIVRAQLGHCPIVLVSATPSLETMYNAVIGRYEHIELPDRHGGASLPDVELIDLKADKPAKNCFIAPFLIEKIRANLESGEQTLLFLNRRGYAPLTICKDCGHRIECPRCTAWLVEHKNKTGLHCHHCGYSMRFPSHCSECNSEDSLTACGPGVERIFEEVSYLFPEAKIVIVASDTAKSTEDLKQCLEDIKDHQYDIIIGTQIIAKGHHFPKLTLVGVIDADLGLQGGDLRAAERTYQLLHQVSGRAGRAELPGVVYLQTYLPNHKVMQALCAHERDVFYEVETDERRQSHMPPFSRLVAIVVSGKNEQQVFDVAKLLGQSAPHSEQVQTLGPAEAPFYRLRGNYRRRLLVRADKNINIQKTVSAWLSSLKIPSTVRVYVDVDPQGFL